jgi:ribosomal small subunit protein bTHX
MGKGDKKTAKGKRKAGSHGNSRPRVKPPVVPVKTKVKAKK